MSVPASFRPSQYCGICKHCNDTDISEGFECLKHGFFQRGGDPYAYVCNDFEEGNPDEEKEKEAPEEIPVIKDITADVERVLTPDEYQTLLKRI